MLVLSSWIMMPVQDKLIAESLFRVFDEDNSGSLNFSEYLQVWPSQELTRNRFDISVSEWQLTTLIDKRQQRRFNFHVGGGRTKAQYVTSRISLQTLAGWPWIWSSTHVNVKGNLVVSAWGELTAHRVHFEHSLLYDSVTTTRVMRVAPG